jgi:hypothetical protein
MYLDTTDVEARIKEFLTTHENKPFFPGGRGYANVKNGSCVLERQISKAIYITT